MRRREMRRSQLVSLDAAKSGAVSVTIGSWSAVLSEYARRYCFALQCVGGAAKRRFVLLGGIKMQKYRVGIVGATGMVLSLIHI